MADEVWDRALEVQRALAGRGLLRAVGIPDLLLAATAERHEVAVLHYDADFDLIASVTGQPVEWVVPRGTLVGRRQGRGRHPVGRLRSTSYSRSGISPGCSRGRTNSLVPRTWGSPRWWAMSDESPHEPASPAPEPDREARDEAALQAWLDTEPGVVVTSHGGLAPEQWEGTVDGHSFYFRERHELWRLELDLRPTGQTYRVWTGSDLAEDPGDEEREVIAGDVIAEGTTTAAAYGVTPVERARFIVGTIRSHLRRQTCDVHRSELDDLEALFGRPLGWCPACGAELAPPSE